MAEKARCEICSKDFPSLDALAMHNSAKHPISAQSVKKSRKPFLIVIFVAVILIGGFFILSGKLTGNSINNNQEIQKITLSFKNYNYYPNTINVKEGVPVEITLDNSIRGCYRSFNIQPLGVSQTSSNPANKITFTPNKKGSFEFACGMRMGTGTIVVG